MLFQLKFSSVMLFEVADVIECYFLGKCFGRFFAMERRMLPVGLKPSNVKDLDEESSDDESSSSEEKDVKRVLDLESESDESTDTSKHTAVSNGKPPQVFI